MPQVKRKHEENTQEYGQEEHIRKKSKFNPQIISNFFRFLWEGARSTYYSIRYCYSNQNNLLRYAISDNNIHLMKWIIHVRQGADVNAVDNDGWTPLHAAARYGYAEAVGVLIYTWGIDVNPANNDNRETPLHVAARNGHAEAVRELLAAPNINVNVVSKYGWTPLHIAAEHGYVEVVRELLTARGINVNADNDSRETPLHTAAGYGHAEAVRVLLNKGDINLNAELIRNGWIPLHVAAYYIQPEIVGLLLTASGINVNAVDNLGCTPLHAMSKFVFHVVVAEQLLGAGADFSIKNQVGETAVCINDLITSNDLREAMIARYKRLLSESPVGSLKEQVTKALWSHLGGKEEERDGTPLSAALPVEILELYRLTPEREKSKSKGNYFNMRAFCEENIHLTREEKERHAFQI